MSRGVFLLLIILIAVQRPATAGAASPPTFLGTWGSLGSGPGEFAQGRLDLTTDAAGHVWVLDAGNLRVQEFSGDGAFLSMWPIQMPPEGTAPLSIAADPSGDLIVLIQSGNVTNEDLGIAIQRYAPAGNLVAAAALGANQPAGAFHCFDLAVTSSGDLVIPYSYVTAPGNQSYAFVRRVSGSFAFVSEFGGAAGTPLPPIMPGVAVDALGNVYLAFSDRVEEFASDGTFVTQWGGSGSADGQFLSAVAIAIDPAGNVYVTDNQLERVQEFTSSGAFLTKWGAAGSGPGQFIQPLSIATDVLGDILVGDVVNARVSKFGPGPTQVIHGTWGALKRLYR